MTEKEIVIDMRKLIDDIKEKVNNGQSVIIKGQGTSMFPFITSDDTLTLDKPPCKIKTGEIYLYLRFDGSYAIHRVYNVKKDFVLMLGDAQLFIEKVNKDRIVAVVSAVNKPYERIDCNSFWARHKHTLCMKAKIYKSKCKATVKKLYFEVRAALGKIKKMIKKKDK